MPDEQFSFGIADLTLGDRTIGIMQDITVTVSGDMKYARGSGIQFPIAGSLANKAVVVEPSTMQLKVATLRQMLGAGRLWAYYNYYGIENPSSTHISKKKSTITTTSAPTSWGGAELSTADYDKIAVQDASSAEETTTVSSEHPQFLFAFVVGETPASVRTLKVRFDAEGYRNDAPGTKSVTWQIWNFTLAAWETLGVDTTGLGTIVEYTQDIDIDDDTYVDSGGNVYISAYTTTAGDGANESRLYIDYVELNTEPGNRLTINDLSPYFKQDDPTAAMLTNSGLDSFNATYCVDNDISTTGWDTDTAVTGAYLKIDLGAANEKAYRRLRLYLNGASYSGTYKIQYSDNDSTWTDAITNFAPTDIGWNDTSWQTVGSHRYWRLYLTNTPGSGDSITEMEWSIDEMGDLSMTAKDRDDNVRIVLNKLEAEGMLEFTLVRDDYMAIGGRFHAIRDNSGNIGSIIAKQVT